MEVTAEAPRSMPTFTVKRETCGTRATGITRPSGGPSTVHSNRSGEISPKNSARSVTELSPHNSSADS